MTDNLLSNTPFEEELKLEISLRPKSFADFVGQTELKEKLDIFVKAAKQRKEALDHVLFSGPPGLGKTSLANILAEEMGVKITTTSGPSLERPGDLAAILTNLNERDVLFIDEIHRLPRIVEEILYPAMEDFRLDLIVGQGPSAKSIQIDIPRFTLVGATTRTGLITSPLRDRFGMAFRIDYYSGEELKTIVERSAKLLSIGIDAAAALEIGRRSRGTPRIANRILKRVRDYAQVHGSKTIDTPVTQRGLAMLEVDAMGFDSMDRKILSMIIEKFQGGPVGVETLSSALSEERETLEDVYEPFLLQCGFIQRTPRGRVATSLAYDHLGFKPKTQNQKELL